jgi:uncharacterized C2H2 Zn-finger protein
MEPVVNPFFIKWQMSADASIDFCQHGATGMHGEETFEKCPRAKVLFLIDFCQHGATGMHGEETFEKCPRAKVLRTEGLGLLKHLIHQYYIFSMNT